MTRETARIVVCRAVSLYLRAPGRLGTGQRVNQAAATTDDGTLKALAAVAGAGTMETHTYEYLEELSDDIGARVTGSPEAARAIPGAWTK